MARKVFLFGILVTMFLFEMTVLSCENVDKELNGTWQFIGDESNSLMQYENGKFEFSRNGLSNLKGTYTTKNNITTRKITHYGDYILFNLPGYNGEKLSSQWHTKTELSKYVSSRDFDLDTYLSRLALVPVTYSVNGDTLTLSWDGGQSTSTKVSSTTRISKTSGNSSVAAGSRSAGNQQALIGRWVEKNRGWEMDFLSDGTGIVDEQRITWKIEGNRLYIIAVSSFGDIFGDNGSYEYRISGSELTLIYSGGSETYVKR